MTQSDKIATALRNGLSWLRNHRDLFTIPRNVSDYNFLTSIKPIGEYTLLLEKLHSRGYPNASESSWAWKQFREGKLIRDMLLARPDLIVISTIYSSFLSLGFSCSATDRVIRYFLQSDYCQAIEMPRWRRLDVMHAEWKLGLRPFSDLTLRGTWISRQPEPWLVSHDVAYAATHEIFYISDFGSKEVVIDDANRKYLKLILSSWAEIYCEESNYDLLSEVIMCASYLGFLDIANFWVTILLEHQRPDGHFPGPSGSASDIIHEDMDERRGNFLRNYHTTIVGCLALLSFDST